MSLRRTPPSGLAPRRISLFALFIDPTLFLFPACRFLLLLHRLLLFDRFVSSLPSRYVTCACRLSLSLIAFANFRFV